MKTCSNLLFSVKALAARRGRTGLTLLGMAIGMASVIVMTALGTGAKREVLQRIDDMGTRMLAVTASKIKTVVGRTQETDRFTTLTLRDWQAITRECPAVGLTAPAQDQPRKVKAGPLATIAQIMGSTPEFFTIRNYRLDRGRIFSQLENRTGRRVAVIGSTVRTNLLAGLDPLGQTIRIGPVPFEVIGVLVEKGVSDTGGSQDNHILIPLQTARRRVFNQDYLHLIYIQVRNDRSTTDAERQITGLLRNRHRLTARHQPDDFSVMNQATVQAAAMKTGDSFTTLIAGMAVISLMVGGIGIMAVMLLTVRERTAEIGLRMAVGSRPRDILWQFLCEALLLGLAGGAGGIALGTLTIAGIGLFTPWQAALTLRPIVAAMLFSLTIGLTFGIYPARRASRLDPITALRSK
jgi:putative ABC transport system permease protein